MMRRKTIIIIFSRNIPPRLRKHIQYNTSDDALKISLQFLREDYTQREVDKIMSEGEGDIPCIPVLTDLLIALSN